MIYLFLVFNPPPPICFPVLDTIGQIGLQLFVNAGQPVDNSLVNALVKEVISEKVLNMLGQRPDDNLDTATHAQGRRVDDEQVSDTEVELEQYEEVSGVC